MRTPLILHTASLGGMKGVGATGGHSHPPSLPQPRDNMKNPLTMDAIDLGVGKVDVGGSKLQGATCGGQGRVPWRAGGQGGGRAVWRGQSQQRRLLAVLDVHLHALQETTEFHTFQTEMDPCAEGDEACVPVGTGN